MAKAKRSPIDYTMRYANSFFRPREVVQHEEKELAKQENDSEMGKVIPKNVETSKQENTFPRLHENVETSKHVSRRNKLDFNQKPNIKYTLIFTADELEALEDVKTHLRKYLGVKAPKNVIARLCIDYLIGEYWERIEESIIVKEIRRKGPSS